MANFNFSFDPGTTLQQMVGFEMAGRYWSAFLNDNTSLNIHVGVSSELGRNVIGGALPGMRASQSYSGYRNALDHGSKSADDVTALNHLAFGSSFTAGFSTVDNGFWRTRVESRETLNMTRAVAKAAGLSLTDGNTALDGYILFSNLSDATTSTGQAVRWSYDYTGSSIAANTLDFLSTAVHEIGHILGFVSGVDQPGWISLVNDAIRVARATDNFTSSTTYIDTMRDRLSYINPLDLFRYNANTAQMGVIDMAYGVRNTANLFSLDRGRTQLAAFSTGADTANGGDGYQASHWANGTHSIMNPTLALGSRRTVAPLDLLALDVIGWDIAPTGINTAIDLSSLYSQSVQAIASRSGQTDTWITSNLTASPIALVQNRDAELDAMIRDSQVYNWGTSFTSSGSTRRMELLSQLFQQQGLFDSLDEAVPTVKRQMADQAAMPAAHNPLLHLLWSTAEPSVARPAPAWVNGFLGGASVDEVGTPMLLGQDHRPRRSAVKQPFSSQRFDSVAPLQASSMQFKPILALEQLVTAFARPDAVEGCDTGLQSDLIKAAEWQLRMDECWTEAEESLR